MNEEAEMKKNIEWLKESVQENIDFYNGINSDWVEAKVGAYKNFLIKISQLDEPEVLSQAWIYEHKKTFMEDGKIYNTVLSDDLQNLIVPKQEITEEQVTEYLRGRNMTAVDSTLMHRESLDSKIVTEIPSIPEFIAEFLEGKEDYMLYELFDDEWLYEEHDQIAKWLYDNDEKTNRERELSLVLAHIHGYEMEVEQRYYVMNNDQRMMLVRMMDGKTITEADPFKLEDMYEAEKKAHRLTEKEIKDYDERYFAFAKPVEEVEAH